MSKKKVIIELEPNALQSKEGLVAGDFRCPLCLGSGGWDYTGTDVVYKKVMSDPDRKVCGMCLGSGRVQAMVTVDWVSSGSIKFKIKD